MVKPHSVSYTCNLYQPNDTEPMMIKPLFETEYQLTKVIIRPSSKNQISKGLNMEPKQQELHLTSLRVPVELHDWLVAYAKKWKTTPAFVYRHALWRFKEQIGNQF